ncbi:MAG: class I SAM-dependent RNA methyltransferase [Lachnospiraceae bacterium]|nr:class I SAM-dependent RNA methyltransferase [Lachnospiraceae bacterium]
MELFEFVAPCHFGLEAVLKREINDLGYDVSSVSDGHVCFMGDAEAMAVANLRLRCAERVLLLVGRFFADNFDSYFEKMKALPWEKFIPEDARFYVTKATSKKSRLFSARDLQTLGKKAMVRALQRTYSHDTFPEDGADYPVRVFIYKDEVMVTLDTTGVPLHKRGYRKKTSAAPIAETLAASLLFLTPWRPDRILMDPFCGSGTFLIEAAQIAANIAAGAYRSFNCEKWDNLISAKEFDELRKEARDEEDRSVRPRLYGYDIDPDMIKIAKENAKRAGVLPMIHFECRPVSEMDCKGEYGFILTNPPYGERLSDEKELPEVYKALGEGYRALDKWSMFLITSYNDAQKYIGAKADRNRKLYNGMLQSYFYQYNGPKPAKGEAY